MPNPEFNDPQFVDTYGDSMTVAKVEGLNQIAVFATDDKDSTFHFTPEVAIALAATILAEAMKLMEVPE